MSISGWLPPDWSKAVLPLSVKSGEVPAELPLSDLDKFPPSGTAFLIDYRGVNALITAKHCVFENDGRRRRNLYLVSNAIDGGAFNFPLDELESKFGLSWKTLGSHDLAATVLPPDTDVSADVRTFAMEILEGFSNIREGDDIFILGFPGGMGVRSKKEIAPIPLIAPIVRGGIIALRNSDKSFYVDANVFPGNSGSPVFLKPSPFEHDASGLRLGQLRSPKLIGIVTGYRTHEDEAVDPQTGELRVIFAENSGLGYALSADIIEELLDSSDFQDMLNAKTGTIGRYSSLGGTT